MVDELRHSANDGPSEVTSAPSRRINGHSLGRGKPARALDSASLPRHVAIIMDGNGRWAKSRDLARLEGHRRGADVVRDITTYARELGVEYLTLYSFSVQNWSRPVGEVAGLMQLLEEYCAKERDTLMNNEIKLATIGELDRLPYSTRDAIMALRKETANNGKMTLTLAIDYGSREEIMRAVRTLGKEIEAGNLCAEDLNEEAVSRCMYAADMPDPDLLVRTSGEVRVSNFLLWQVAYSEFHFTEVLWPDFTRANFDAALADFAGRKRRYGATQEQIDLTDLPVANPAGEKATSC